MRKWLISVFVLSCLFMGMTEKIPVSVSAEQPTTKKLAVSSDRIYVLQQESRKISILDENGKEWKEIEVVTPYSRALPRPVDIAFFDNTLYVLDAEFCEIWCYDAEGVFTHHLPLVTQYLQIPSALTTHPKGLLIADIGCIWVTDFLGHVNDRITLPPDSKGMPALISDIVMDGVQAYFTDLNSGRIMRAEGNKSSWTFTEGIVVDGGIGHELSRYMELSGITLNGNLVVTDYLTGGITQLHSVTSQPSQIAYPNQAITHPTDIVYWKNRLWMAEYESEALGIVETEWKSSRKKSALSVNILDFGTQNQNTTSKMTVKVCSVDGTPISGTISSSNPVFIPDKTQFAGETAFDIDVNLNIRLIKDNARETGTITVKLDSGDVQTVEVKARKKNDPDFQLLYNDFGLKQESLPHSLTLQCRRQNDLTDNLEFSTAPGTIPFEVKWELQTMPVVNELQYNHLYIKPLPQTVSGFYSLPVTVKCPEIKSVKSLTISFYYRGMDQIVPGTILGEYFAADWCEFCPAGHMALPELHQKYTKDEIVFMTYYNDCMESTPERLCFSEGETRMKWYNPVGIHVALILNGTTIKEGGYNDGVTTMTKEYDELIKGLSPMKTPVSLSGSANWDPTSHTLQVGATLQCLQEMNWKNPRLYCVLAEHGIAFNAKNGVKEHNYVIRDFLALPNPENNEAFGSPVWGMDGEILSKSQDQWQGHLETLVDPLVKMENAFCLLFVQDNETKQVYQARYVPLQQEAIHGMAWVPENKSVRLNQDQRGNARMWLVNRGNRIDRFDVLVNNRKPFMGEDTWKVNGDEYSIQQTVSVTLNPMESVLVEFTLNPIWGKPEMPYLDVKAVNASGDEAYCLIPVKGTEHQPRFEVLYPNSSILDKEKRFSIDRNQFSCVIRTEPGTYMESNSLNKASSDGILVFHLSGCYKEYQFGTSLVYPDQQTQSVQFYYKFTLKMKLTIGSRLIWVNREKIEYEAAPFIQNSRTMVPIRIIIENLICGAEVEWDPVKQTVSINADDLRIVLQVGKSVANVNGKIVPLDAPPIIRNGRTFLPIRFVAETLGAVVEWDGKTQDITITK